MTTKQVRFYDKENDMEHGGILTDYGLICGCCGGVIELDEIGPGQDYEITEEYKYWVPLDDEIIGE